MATIPYDVPRAFVAGNYARSGAFFTDGNAVYSYAMRLAHKDANGVIVYDYIPLAHGNTAPSATTQRHMRALESVCAPPARKNPETQRRLLACRRNPCGTRHNPESYLIVYRYGDNRPYGYSFKTEQEAQAFAAQEQRETRIPVMVMSKSEWQSRHPGKSLIDEEITIDERHKMQDAWNSKRFLANPRRSIRKNPNPKLIAAGVGVLALAGGAAYFFLKNKKSEVPAP